MREGTSRMVGGALASRRRKWRPGIGRYAMVHACIRAYASEDSIAAVVVTVASIHKHPSDDISFMAFMAQTPAGPTRMLRWMKSDEPDLG